MYYGDKKDFLEELDNDPTLRSIASKEGYWVNCDGVKFQVEDMEYGYLCSCSKMLKGGYWNDALSREDNERARAMAVAKAAELDRVVLLLQKELDKSKYKKITQEQKMKMTLRGVGVTFS